LIVGTIENTAVDVPVSLIAWPLNGITSDELPPECKIFSDADFEPDVVGAKLTVSFVEAPGGSVMFPASLNASLNDALAAPTIDVASITIDGLPTLPKFVRVNTCCAILPLGVDAKVRLEADVPKMFGRVLAVRISIALTDGFSVTLKKSISIFESAVIKKDFTTARFPESLKIS